MLKNILIVFAVLYSQVVSAQLKSYSHLVGRIVNEQNEPITNASVQIVGFGSKKSNSIDGSFSFDKLPHHKNLILNISVLGYEYYQDILHLDQDSSILITMHEITERLDSLLVKRNQSAQVIDV
ncbi:MAG: carboxypeptidase-like regulatory domain-containing protein, partial [Sphingobacterium sp.]